MSMSVSSALHFLYEHPQNIMYGALILCLITAALLLLRGAGDDAGAGKSSSTGVDLNAMEALLKRIMVQAQGMPVAAAASGAAPEGSLGSSDPGVTSAKLAAAAADTSSADAARLAVLIGERDKKIAELQSAVEEAKKASVAAAAAAPADGASAADGGGASSPELQQKIKDLEARLAEYAIIEDDIADLSLFKEENQRLKAEVEEMRQKVAQAAGGGVAAPQPAEVEAPAPTPVAVAPAAAPVEEDDPLLKEYQEAVASNSVPAMDIATSIPVAETPTAAPVAAAPISTPVVDSAADPLGGALDTDKMLEEVASLDAQPELDGQDALIDTLDTDKLLAEVNELDSGNDPAPEEDLFGEFNDKEKA